MGPDGLAVSESLLSPVLAAAHQLSLRHERTRYVHRAVRLWVLDRVARPASLSAPGGDRLSGQDDRADRLVLVRDARRTSPAHHVDQRVQRLHLAPVHGRILPVVPETAAWSTSDC